VAGVVDEQRVQLVGAALGLVDRPGVGGDLLLADRFTAVEQDHLGDGVVVFGLDEHGDRLTQLDHRAVFGLGERARGRLGIRLGGAEHDEQLLVGVLSLVAAQGRVLLGAERLADQRRALVGELRVATRADDRMHHVGVAFAVLEAERVRDFLADRRAARRGGKAVVRRVEREDHVVGRHRVPAVDRGVADHPAAHGIGGRHQSHRVRAGARPLAGELEVVRREVPPHRLEDRGGRHFVAVALEVAAEQPARVVACVVLGKHLGLAEIGSIEVDEDPRALRRRRRPFEHQPRAGCNGDRGALGREVVRCGRPAAEHHDSKQLRDGRHGGLWP